MKNDSSLSDLESYLDNEFNYDIYEYLSEPESVFEPLEFFRLLYSEWEFIQKNKAKPLTIKTKIRHLNLGNEERQHIFCHYLTHLIGNENEDDDIQLEICRKEIQKIVDEIEKGWKEKAEKESVKLLSEFPTAQENYDKMLEHLETLPNLSAKIEYLERERIEFEKYDDPDTLSIIANLPDSFYWMLKAEIKYLKELEILELNKIKTENNLSVKPNDKEILINKHKDLTLDRATLAMNYLLRFAKANGHNTDKARFISFLTGYSENTIAQKFSTLHKKEDADFTAYEKDMNIIRKYFEKLGLNEIVKMIDNDLEV